MSKPLVIGTIVVVVGLFAAGGFLLWQTSHQQTGLKPASPTPEQLTVQQTPPPAPSPQPQEQQDGVEANDEPLVLLDKEQYLRDFEDVTGSVLNDSNNTYFLKLDERKEVFDLLEWQQEKDGAWKQVEPSYPSDSCVAVNPKERLPYKFPYTLSSFSTYTKVGTYRLVLEYWEDESCQGEPREVFSQEFSIVDKHADFTSICPAHIVPLEITQIQFDEDPEKELTVLCGGHVLDDLSIDPADIDFYVLDGRTANSKVIYRWFPEGARTASIPELVDINEDGFTEIYWTQRTHGGTCTCVSNSMVLVSGFPRETFSMSSGGCFNSQCTFVIAQPFTFSENLSDALYSSLQYFIRNFFLEKAIEERIPNSDIFYTTGIIFPNGYEGLTIGKSYHVLITLPANFQGESGVSLYKGEEELGYLDVSRPGELYFVWEAGTYRTKADEVKIAPEGNDYRIGVYTLGSKGVPVDFSDEYFSLTTEK